MDCGFSAVWYYTTMLLYRVLLCQQEVSKTWFYISHCVKVTSNAVITLVETKQYCLKKLFKTVRTTHWISEFIKQ